MQSLKCCNGTTLTIPAADMTGKWILISGGNSGIGREAALQLAKLGANIIIACRPNPPPREPHPTAVVDELKHAAKAAGKLDSQFENWEVDMASISSVQFVIPRALIFPPSQKKHI